MSHYCIGIEMGESEALKKNNFSVKYFLGQHERIKFTWKSILNCRYLWKCTQKITNIYCLQEDKSRVRIFRNARHGNVWQPFLNLLNRQDEFVQHMTARIIAKLACWHSQLMDKSDLHFYLSWLKDQLKYNVSDFYLFVNGIVMIKYIYIFILQFLCMMYRPKKILF